MNISTFSVLNQCHISGHNQNSNMRPGVEIKYTVSWTPQELKKIVRKKPEVMF